ncbi:MAG: phosphoglycerate dehydrogenase [Planctomycetota bacterium]
MTTHRILAADKLSQDGLDFIESQPDAQLLNRPGLADEEYAKLLANGDADAMIVRSGITVTPEMLANPGTLKIIARAGVGVDNIDLPAATEKGILVVNTAEASTITTAEHAFTLMMALLRNVGPAYKTMTTGGWDRSKYAGRQLHGLTLGVVGFGRIGQTMAHRALAFGMDVVAFDPVWSSPTALDGKVKMFSDFKAMLPLPDVLSFHVPLNDHTRGMLNAETFALCKKGVFAVNAARGGVIDETDLLAALDSGQCGGAALDVFTSEPPPEDSPLRSHPKLLVTPHLGASTKEAQQAVSIDAAKACLAYLRGEGIKGAVNAGGLRVDLDPLQHAFVDLAQRMAALLSPMITRGIAKVEISLAGQAIAKAAGTIERSAMVGLLQAHLADPVNLINVADVAASRGIKLTTSTCDDPSPQGPELSIEVFAPAGTTDTTGHPGDKTRKITGRVYDDLRPHVVDINGYVMDMTPAGPMLLLLNDDRPGMVGLIGTELGKAGVNIADMTISPRAGTALQVLKVSDPVPPAVLDHMRTQPGINKAEAVTLPSLDHA